MENLWGALAVVVAVANCAKPAATDHTLTADASYRRGVAVQYSAPAMRLGIIAAAGASATKSPLIGERDAQLMRERIGLPDMGFSVHVLDPASDMAEQIDALLSDYQGRLDGVLFFASAVCAAVEGECFLCVDPAHPDVGDSVRDVSEALARRAEGSGLMVIEARYDDNAPGALAVEAVAEALTGAIDVGASGLEAIVAVRSARALPERVPSRLTAQLLEAIDAEPGQISAEKAYAAVMERGDLGSWANAAAYLPGRGSLLLRDPASLAPPLGPSFALSAPDPRPLPAPLAPAPTPDARAPATLAPAAPASRPSRPRPSQPRRPAPPSERADAATVTLASLRAPKQKDAELPKVVIAEHADPRKKPTLRKIDKDANAPAQDRSAEPRAALTSPDDADSVDEPTSQSGPPPATPITSSPSPTPPPADDPSAAAAPKKPAAWTVGDHMAEGDRLHQGGDLVSALAEYKKALGKLGTASTPQRAELYVRVGQVLRGQGQARIAVSNFEKALAIIPGDERAMQALIELHAEQGNWRSAYAAEDKLLSAACAGSAERLRVLLSCGDRALGHGDDAQARARYQLARDEYPKEPAPLERLLPVFERQQAVDHALDTRRRIAALIDDPTARARAYLDIGRYCLGVQREEEGFGALELALDSDPAQLEALEVLAAALAEGQEWAEIERIYQKMIRAFSTRNDLQGRSVAAELHRRLALLYRDHLEDPERALRALEGEIAIRPDDLGAILLAADLCADRDAAKTLVHLRRAAEIAPADANVYRRALSLAQRHGEPETAFLAASVLVASGAATDSEQRAYERHKVEGVPAHKRPIRREAWSWLRSRDHDAAVDAVMRAVAPAVLRARVLQLEEQGKMPSLPDRQDPKNTTISVVRSIAWACRHLSLEEPAIYIDDKLEAPLSARLARHQAVVVGKGAVRGKSLGELAFLVARHVALRTPEHELCAHMQTIDELSACFQAAIKLVLGKVPPGPLSPIVDPLARLLTVQMTDAERAKLEPAVKKIAERGGELNLTAWVASVERCATRAGLLMCGDLPTAVQLVTAEGDSPFSTAKSRIEDLYAFCMSGPYTKLRQELGSSLLEKTERPRLSMPPG